MPQSILTLAQHSPDVRESLKAIVSDICHEMYSSEKAKFVATLTDYEQAVYAEMVKLPYDEKDFWRDLHDIIVTSQMKQLVAASSGSIPDWLVVAALMHDRGYAVLAEISRTAKGNLSQRDYLSLSGAHWDVVDTRIQHSFLSSKIAEYMLTGSTDDATVLDIVKQYEIAPSVLPDHITAKSSEIVTVVLQHDLPLIGRYREIKPETCHHFDADSLYSISVSSFIKDYLFYLSDEGMTGDQASFDLQDLLGRRLNRYFEPGDVLPPSLQSMLTDTGRHLGRETIRPHSPEALERTVQAFLRLERLLTELSATTALVDFSAIAQRYVTEEVAAIYSSLQNN